MQSPVDQQFIDSLDQLAELYPGAEKIHHSNGLVVYSWPEFDLTLSIINQNCLLTHQDGKRLSRFRFFADSYQTTVESVREEISLCMPRRVASL